MNCTLASRMTFSLAIAGAFALTTACGGGINTPTAQGSVASTQNPLVAQYTITSGCTGPAFVEFGPDTNYGRTTAPFALPGHYLSSPVQVAGMRASTTYHMRAQVQCGSETITTADTTFKTGALPSSITFPALTVSRPNPSLSSLENPGIEMVTVPEIGTPALFTDRDGNPIWYYDVGQGNYPYTFKLLNNGHILLSITTPNYSLLREVDLAGNTIREMQIGDLQIKMRTAGADFVPGGFHHDILPLDNGHLIVLVDCWQYFTDLPNYPGTIQLQGDGIIDLDENWNPVWMWNTFDHLDPNRHLQPTLSGDLLDWTHSNALVYSPPDGNLLLSMRHQSWVIKINYNNGTGDGSIVWHLGYQGDFALTQNGVPTDDPSLWFSFQHFPVILNQSGSQTTLAVWDNGNNRVMNTAGAECTLAPGGIPCFSRASIYQVDESAKTADLQWDDLQPSFGEWGGSINQFANGNVEFDLNSPAVPPAPNIVSQVQEVTQTDTPQVVWEMNFPTPSFAYRAYRVPSLYNGVTWQY